MSLSEARRIHIEAWQTSGMSQAAYCREHGLNTKTFGNWVRKHRAGQVIRSPALVPVMSLAIVKETLNNSSNGSNSISYQAFLRNY